MKSLLNKRTLMALFASTILGLTLVSCGEKAAEAPPTAETPATDTPAPSTQAPTTSPADTAAVAPAGDEEKVLNIYNWSDYLAEDTIPNFEKETGIKVVTIFLIATRFCMPKWSLKKRATILWCLHLTGAQCKLQVAFYKSWIKANYLTGKI